MRDDGDIVRAVCEGHPELYRELVDRHAPAVFRIVRATVNQEADAEDTAQEVFLTAFRKLTTLREPARFRSWLLSIAARKSADFLRKKYRSPDVLPLDGEPVAPPPDDKASRLRTVEEIVAGLSPGARLIFALRHHEGLACTQIATMLDLPKGTVYSRLSRIHDEIRRAAGVRDR